MQVEVHLRVNKTNFHMKDFETEAKGNSDIAYYHLTLQINFFNCSVSSNLCSFFTYFFRREQLAQ